MPLTNTPTAFETMPDTMYLTETISAAAASMTLNYVPLAITSGIMILDEGTDREERVSFSGVTDNGDGTATYTDMRRGLAFGGGTAYAASIATAYEHTGNSSTARLVLAHEYMNKSMFTDRNNLLDANVEIRFGNSGDAVYGDGSELYFKSQTTAAKSLAQLAAAGGSDEKVKISINDTTSNYLLSKLTGGDGILLSEVDDGSDESIDIDLDLATDPGLEITSQKVRVKVKTSGGITRDSDGLSLDTTASVFSSIFKMAGDGSDGAKSIASSENLDPTSVYNYTTLTLDAAQTLSVSSVNSVLRILNTGDVTINGTVDLNGKGGAGGAGGGTGTAGTAGNSLISGFTNGAGSGAAVQSGNGKSGGGGSGISANGSASSTSGTAGGTAITERRLAMLNQFLNGAVCGAGGGGGSNDGGGNAGGAGGAGGGALVWFIAGNLTLGASSIIRANGAQGSSGVSNAGAGGGGGGGNIIIIVAGSITNSGATISASGGASRGGPGGDNSGAGGAGRAVIYSISDGTVITA